MLLAMGGLPRSVARCCSVLPPMKGPLESEKFESEKFALPVAGVFTGVCVEDNACSTNPTHTTNAHPDRSLRRAQLLSYTMHGHQKKPELTKFYALFKLTALCALFHEAAALPLKVG